MKQVTCSYILCINDQTVRSSSVVKGVHCIFCALTFAVVSVKNDFILQKITCLSQYVDFSATIEMDLLRQYSRSANRVHQNLYADAVSTGDDGHHF